MKGIDVSAVFIIPEMVFDKYLHSDLSFGHARIISDEAGGEAKKKLSRLLNTKTQRVRSGPGEPPFAMNE
jgi:hypothetical protein